ncbi:hypothetical protein [Parapedobacter koreensis]|uniref:Glycosyl hydrolase family 20, domain 2 n=1 Tax=Parapedobacter koreensis TaxID=332977 RepID=A0A1H7UJU7_9SPHI|nr:hypothetical protein [Parapedobacter koreensis]SEL97340.1 hypothetical protein SAMN05421740_1178 [Parapedobacter koreensis]
MSILKIVFIALFSFVFDMNVQAKVTIVFDTEVEPVNYGVNLLRQTLIRQGLAVRTYHKDQVTEMPTVWVLSANESVPSLLAPYLESTDFSDIQEEGYKYRWINEGKTLLILSTDAVGSLYGLLDVMEYAQTKGTFSSIPGKLINPGFAYRIVKFNLPWSPYRTSGATEVHMHTCRDLAFWERFLDMMVENRLNVLSLWNNHPFPYMIKSKNFPKATPFDDAELADWQMFWKTLFRMAKERGIQTFIVNWNIVVSPEFAEAYGVKEYGDRSEQVKQYTRESVTQLINEYEDLTGLGVTLADWMGNFNERMEPQEREDWIEETFVRGIKTAKRPVKFIHRSVLAGDPMAMRNLIDKAAFDEPVLVEIKFNWSHGHSTPVLAISHDYHSGELDDRFWEPLPENYRIQWMVRNEDFFILRWGQPDFIREHISVNNHPYVNGYFIGSEGYIPAMDYSQRPSSDKTWQYAFEKQWFFYKVWGRLLYQPDTPDEIFATAFDLRYGNQVGHKLLEAYKLASNMPLRLASFHRSTWDYTLYAEGFIEAEPSSTDFFDRSSPFIAIDEFIHHETLDPNMLDIPSFVRLSLGEEIIPPGKITPLALAASSEADSKRALELIDSLKRHVNEYSGALGSELEDLATWSYLGLYFADKLKAGVALELYQKSGDEAQGHNAIALLEGCLRHWDQVVAYTNGRYFPTPHVSTERWGSEFQVFGWEQLRPQVLRDIQIAKKIVGLTD